MVKLCYLNIIILGENIFRRKTNAYDLRVIVGTNQADTKQARNISVLEILPHERFNRKKSTYYIALLLLGDRIDPNSFSPLSIDFLCQCPKMISLWIQINARLPPPPGLLVPGWHNSGVSLKSYVLESVSFCVGGPISKVLNETTLSILLADDDCPLLYYFDPSQHYCAGNSNGLPTDACQVSYRKLPLFITLMNKLCLMGTIDKSDLSNFWIKYQMWHNLNYNLKHESGGPLVCDNNKLFGLMSNGIGCELFGMPSLYTKVSFFSIGSIQQ